MLTTFSFLLLLFHSPDSSFQKNMLPVYEEVTGAHILIPENMSDYTNFRLRNKLVFAYGKSGDSKPYLSIYLSKLSDTDASSFKDLPLKIYRRFSNPVPTNTSLVSLNILDTTAYTVKTDTIVEPHHRREKQLYTTYTFQYTNIDSRYLLNITMYSNEYDLYRNLIFQIANSVYFDR